MEDTIMIGKRKKFFGKISIVGVILMISGIGIIFYLLQGYTAAVQVEYKMKAGLKAEPVSSLNTGNDGGADLQPRKEAESNIDIMEASINVVTPENITAATDSSLALKTKAKETTTWKGDEDNPRVFARMTIPKIDLAVPVVEGVEKADIKLAIGHVPGTASPGDEGNSAYAGHRSHTYGKFFHRLGEIELGDEIIIETEEYKFKYSVIEIFTVNPDEVWVLDDVPGETLITLITCEPLYGNKYRLIVRGSLAG